MAVDSSYKDAPTRTVSAGPVDFAYRDLGPRGGVRIIFLVHLAGTLDNWNPRVVDGIAAKHRDRVGLRPRPNRAIYARSVE